MMAYRNKVCIKLRNPDPLWNRQVSRLSEYAEVCITYNTVQDADILIGTNITTDDIEKMPRLKAIFLAKTGVEALPLSLIEKRGILLVASHACSHLVAEHAVALAYALVHRVAEADRDMRAGRWSARNLLSWKPVSKMDVGIFGFGHIGSLIAELMSGRCRSIASLSGRGMNVPETVETKEAVQDLLHSSDLVFICVPDSDQNRGILDRHMLSCASGGYLVNVSRFGICDELALFELLNDGTIAGFASDVWPKEPDKGDESSESYPFTLPFDTLDNVVMSPHIATHTDVGHTLYVCDAVTSCLDYLEKSDPNRMSAVKCAGRR